MKEKNTSPHTHRQANARVPGAIQAVQRKDSAARGTHAEGIKTTTGPGNTGQLQSIADAFGGTPSMVPPVQRQENKTGLPDNLKSGVENLSGLSMDDVRVHYNSSKPAQLQAHAYAQGTDIHMAPGQEKHLAHEAWHVVQQKQGRVQPTKQLKGQTPVNDDAGLEHEADVMGAKAQGMSSGVAQKQAIVGSISSPIVQRLKKKPANTNVDIKGLTLVRVFDILNRPNPDTDPEGYVFEHGDSEALRQHADQLLPGAYQSIVDNQVSEAKLKVMRARNVKVDGQVQQRLLAFMKDMETEGHVIGLKDWVAYTSHLKDEQQQDHINELWEAVRQLLVERNDKIDLRESVIDGSEQTADLSFGNTKIEVKTIRQPISRGQDLNGQLTAGLAKFNGADVSEGKKYEVTLFASISDDLINRERTSNKKNVKTSVKANPESLDITTIRSRRDNAEELNRTTENLRTYIEQRLNGHPSGEAEVSKVTVIMENANSFVAIKQIDNSWTTQLL